MMRKKSVFEPNKAGALQNLAKHLTRDKDVKMIYDVRSVGGLLGTDGKLIFVPMVSDSMIEEYKHILYPGVWHEAAHIKRTDFDVKPRLIYKTALEVMLDAYIEDIRIEYHEAKDHPIAGDEFKTLREWVTNRESEKTKDPMYEVKVMKDPSEILTILGMCIYLKLYDFDISFFPKRIVEMYGFIKKDIDKFIVNSDPGKQGTHQTVETVKKIVKKLKKFLKESKRKEEKKRKEANDSKDNDEDMEGDNDSNSSNLQAGNNHKRHDEEGEENDEEREVDKEREVDEDDSPPIPKEGSSTLNNSDGDEPKGNGKEDEIEIHVGTREGKISEAEDDSDSNDGEINPDENGNAKLTITQSDSNANDNAKSLDELIEEAKKNEVKSLYVEILVDTSIKMKDQLSGTYKSQHLPYPEAAMEDSEDTPRLSRTEYARNEYKRIELEVEREVKKLSTKTEALLMSKKRTHLIPDRTEGEIDQSALYSIRSGNKRVFRTKEHVRKLNTAITLLGDESASMLSLQKIQGVQKALLACGKQCHRMRTPFEILGFSTRTRTSPAYRKFKNLPSSPAKDAMLAQYNRFEPLNHTIYKAFNEDFDKAKYRLVQMRAHSCNSDSESILWAANRLILRPERRKILIVFSDGWPNVDMANDTVMENELRRAIKRLTTVGIEVYGVGIYTDGVKEFYSKYSVIQRGKDNIAEAIFAVLSSKLMASAGY